MAYDALIFDLDGTLWDAAAGSAHGWNLALAKLGMSSRVTVDGIRSVSGNPFSRCVEILLPELHPGSAELLEALDLYERIGIETAPGVLYDGVVGGVSRLAEVYPLFIVSNCPEWYLREFLKTTGLDTYLAGFDCHGASGVSKSRMLAGIRAARRLTRPVYVGDTQGDYEAAYAAAMDFIFVQYGFGDVAGARLRFASFGALVEYLLNVHERERVRMPGR